jgi:putative inorganic carbon (hco3(-)) transporter
LRGLVITSVIIASFLCGLIKHQWALVGFNCIIFLRPQSLDLWGSWGTVPVFQIGVFILLITSFRTGNFKIKFNFFTSVLFLLYLWIIVSAIFSVNSVVSWGRFNSLYINLVPAILLLSFSICSMDNVKICLASMAGFILLLSSKVGFFYSLRGGGHIVNNIDGFVGDNNCFGLSICLALGIITGIMSMIKKKYIKYIISIGIILSILTVLYTQSRGAFMTLAIIFLFGILSSKKPVRNFIIIAIIVVVGYSILPKDMFSRLDTVNNLQTDDSAQGRFQMWHNALKYANSHPITGLGIGCYRYYNSIMAPDGPQLVTHSVYFQVLSELGYVGLLIYLYLIISSLINLHLVYRKAKKYSQLYHEVHWIETTAFWMRNALFGYIFGSAFLDMLVYDIPWYTMLYGSMLGTFFDTYINNLQIQYQEKDIEPSVNLEPI